MTMTKKMAGAGILADAMLLELTLGGLGTRQKLNVGDVTPDSTADPSMLHFAKDILKSESLQNIRRAHADIRSWVRDRSVPAPFLKGGLYLVRNKAVEQLAQYLNTAVDKINDELIPAFLAEYPGAVEQARERLKEHFDPSDYPSVETLRSSFTHRWQWLAMTTPPELDTISPTLAAQERQKRERLMVEAAEEITLLLRSELKSLVDRMVDRLTPGEDGKPRIFRDSLVTNLADFFERFDLRNVTHDEELEKIIADCKTLLSGANAEELRKTDGVRDHVRNRMAEVAEKLETMVGAKPRRMIAFEDEK